VRRVTKLGGNTDDPAQVNNNAINQMTLHTSQGCTLTTPMNATGTVLTTNCDALGTGNLGCGVKAPAGPSFGGAFNGAKGGVFATLWNDSGISIWFWPRSQVPADVRANRPKPASWGAPASFFSSSTCGDSFFAPQTIVFVRRLPAPSLFEKDTNSPTRHAQDTTLCGDWAGSPDGASIVLHLSRHRLTPRRTVYGKGDGCPGTCAQRVMRGANFKQA
jgi:hypothetical protein